VVAFALGLAIVGVAMGDSRLTLSAVPGFNAKFDKKTLTAKSGKVTIVLLVRNAARAGGHNIAIKGHGLNVYGKIVTNGTSSVTAVLKPGTYEFYCSVGGHQFAGMRGALIVK